MYVKIHEQIFGSSIMEEDIETRYVWFCLLTLADKGGFIDITIPAIARRINVDVEIVKRSIDKFLQPDITSRTPHEEGRRLVQIRESFGWKIVNYEHYRDLKSAEEKREYMRNYMAERRKKTSDVSRDVKNQETNKVNMLNDVSELTPHTHAQSQSQSQAHSQAQEYSVFETENSNECEMQDSMPENNSTQKQEPSVKTKGLEEFMRTGRTLRESKPPEPYRPTTTDEERIAETKKRQKVMEWFLNYITIHPKKVKRNLVEQIWCDIFFDPSLSDEDAKKLYVTIITTLQTQKDNHPRDDVNYQFFPAADAWLRDGRWMDEVETRKPETLQERADRLKKSIERDK